MSVKKEFSAKGFTLIELIIVIVIIGILAGIAIPKFINQTTNARKAALAGMATALNSTVMLAIAEYTAEANNASTTITMTGQAVTVTAGSGLPTGNAAGIGAAIKGNQGFTPTYGSTTVFNFTTAVTNCTVSYDSTSGAVTTTTAGC